MNLFVYICLIAFSLMRSMHAALPESVEILPVADTSLFESNPDNDLGNSSALPVGANNRGQRSRWLLKFDIAKVLPRDVTILNATLQFTVVNASVVNSDFRFHRVLTNWAEGRATGNTGSVASEGASTWNHRQSPNIAWSAPGGQMGVDFAAQATTFVPMQSLGNYVVEGLKRDLELWLLDPGANHGWLVQTDQESTPQTSRRIASREDNGKEPKLKITFSKMSKLSPAQIVQPRLSPKGLFEFLVVAPTGVMCDVQTSLHVPGGQWSSITNFLSLGTETEFPIQSPFKVFESPARFFRVLQTPIVP